MDLAVHAATQTGVGHSQQVWLVELQARVDLIVELVARAAGTGAQRATALNHELLDDTVEGQAVVELAMGRLAGVRVRPFLLAGGEAQEVGHGVRSLVVEQVDGDAALRGMHDDGSHGPKCLMGLRPAGNPNPVMLRGAGRGTRAGRDPERHETGQGTFSCT